jgi:hypothetical protein
VEKQLIPHHPLGEHARIENLIIYVVAPLAKFVFGGITPLSMHNLGLQENPHPLLQVVSSPTAWPRAALFDEPLEVRQIVAGA